MAVIKLYASRNGSLALSTNQDNAEVLKTALALLAVSAVEKFGKEGAARLFDIAMELHYKVKTRREARDFLGFHTCGEYYPEDGDGTVLLAEIESAELASKSAN